MHPELNKRERGEDDPVDGYGTTPKMQRSASSYLTVDLETNVVPMQGRKEVGAVVTVKDSIWDAMRAEAKKDADVLFAIDTSGSMTRSMESLGKALSHFVKSVESTHKRLATQGAGATAALPLVLNFAFGVWNSTCKFPGLSGEHADVERLPFGYVPFGPAHEVGEAAMLNIKNSFFSPCHATGTTNMEEAIVTSLGILKQRRAAKHNSDPTYLQHLVVFTDGHPNEGQKETLQETVRREIGDDAVVVHMFILGEHVDLKLAQKLSVDTTNGCIAYASSSTDLEESFDSILNVITKSSIPFNIKITHASPGDGTEPEEKVIHCGTLNKGLNFQTEVKLHFGPKTEPGNHIAASIRMMTGTTCDSVPVAVMPCYAKEGDPVLQSEIAQPSDGYKTFAAAVKLEADIMKQITDLVSNEQNGDNFDTARLDAILDANRANLTQDGIHRLSVLIKSLKRDFQRGAFSQKTATPFSRMATLTARMSQSQS